MTFQGKETVAPVEINAVCLEDGYYTLTSDSALALVKLLKDLKAANDKIDIPLEGMPASVSTIIGDAKIEKTEGGSTLDIELTTPKAVGVLLPNTITIDGQVTANVEWYYGTNTTPVNLGGKTVYVGENEDPAEYSYKLVTPKVIAEDADSYFPITVIPRRVSAQEQNLTKEQFESVAIEVNNVELDYEVQEDPSELPEHTSNGTVYTFNYNGEANRPTASAIIATIKSEQKAYDVEFELAEEHGTETNVTAHVYFKREDTTPTDFTVNVVAMTEVKYGTETIGWVEKEGGTAQVGNFKQGTVLITGVQGIKVGEAQIVGADGKVSVTPVAYNDTDPDNIIQGTDTLYVYNAFKVETKADAGKGIGKVSFAEGWEGITAKEKSDNAALLSGDVLGVVANTKLKIKGADTTAEDRLNELRYGDDFATAGARVSAASGVAADYNLVTITDDMANTKGADKGSIVIGEAIKLWIVKVGTSTYYVPNGTDLVIEDLPEGVAYIVGTGGSKDTDPKTDEAGDVTATTVGANGKLTIANVQADATYFEAYPMVVANGIITGQSANKAVIPATASTNVTMEMLATGGTEVATTDYITVGTQVLIRATDANTNLSATGATLKHETALDEAGKLGYSFTMPSSKVTITSGKGVTVTAGDAAGAKNDANALKEKGGEYVIKVVLTGGEQGIEATKPTVAAASSWPLDDAGNSTNAPKNLKWTVSEGTWNERNGEATWYITFTATNPVPESTYYAPISIDGVDVYEAIGVQPSVTLTVSSLTALANGLKYNLTLPEIKITGENYGEDQSMDTGVTGAWTYKTTGTSATTVDTADAYVLTFTGLAAKTAADGYTTTGVVYPTIGNAVQTVSGNDVVYTFPAVAALTVTAKYTDQSDVVTTVTSGDESAAQALKLVLVFDESKIDTPSGLTYEWTVTKGGSAGSLTGTNFTETLDLSGESTLLAANETENDIVYVFTGNVKVGEKVIGKAEFTVTIVGTPAGGTGR